MGEQSQSGQFLSAMRIHLQRGEIVQSLLLLGTNSKEGQPPNESCFVLTDQRILHVADGGAEPGVQSVPLREVAAAEVAKHPRYIGFLLAAGFVFMIGIPFAFALAVYGAFSGAVLGGVLLLGGGFLAVWWYSGGNTMLRVTTRDKQLEGLVGSKRRREADDFVDILLKHTG